MSNCYEGVWYFRRERYELLVGHALLAALRRPNAPDPAATVARLLAAAAAAGYREHPFLSAIVVPPPAIRTATPAPRVPPTDETGATP